MYNSLKLLAYSIPDDEPSGFLIIPFRLNDWMLFPFKGLMIVVYLVSHAEKGAYRYVLQL